LAPWATQNIKTNNFCCYTTPRSQGKNIKYISTVQLLTVTGTFA
jgi:hypothetical protein